MLHSRWAYWLDIPVSVPALLVYLALLGATVLLRKRPAPDDERGSWAAIIALSVIVAGAALWFVGLQVFVIKAFCKFCMTAHACGFVAAVLCLCRFPWRRTRHAHVGGRFGKTRRPAHGHLGGLARPGGRPVLAGGQLLVQKELNMVKDLRPMAGKGEGDQRLGAAAALAARAVPDPRPQCPVVAPRLLSLYSNVFLLQLDTLPMMGSPDASNVIVCLFDYTCPHCRSLHPVLLEAQRR